MNGVGMETPVFGSTPGNGLGTEVPSLEQAGFEELRERPPTAGPLRFLAILRHGLGLLFGFWIDWTRRRPEHERFGLRYARRRWTAALATPLVDRRLRRLPFPEQLSRRLEILGPTFIKLGQLLSLREDLLPREITDELGRLLDRLPAVPFPRFLELVAEDLGRPVDELFAWIEPLPLGSASIAQTHRARTVDGDDVVIKAVKPQILPTLARDAGILRIVARVIQWIRPRYPVVRIVDELTELTLQEADLCLEAEHAETFSNDFADRPEIRFPRIYGSLCGPRTLTMELFEGPRPDAPEALELAPETRRRLVDLGIGAVVDQFFLHGFFHADLHPANLRVLAGPDGPRVGFLDFGLVGRFDSRLRRRLLLFYYCLVSGDGVTAADYLLAVSETGPDSDVAGFRRQVESAARRWARSAKLADVSFARLILECVTVGARRRVIFPVELTLMAKSLVTFECVGRKLCPELDVADASKPHLRRIILQEWSPLQRLPEGLHQAPEWIDAFINLPLLLQDGLDLLERSTRPPQTDPFHGLGRSIFGGFWVLSGAVAAVQGVPWPVAAACAGVGWWWAARTPSPRTP